MSNTDYKLIKEKEEKEQCSKLKTLIKRLTYQIPDQDQLSTKKDFIWKLQLVAIAVGLATVLSAVWLYNADHPLVEFKFDAITELKLPVLTLCLPLSARTLNSVHHYFSFREFNLDNVTRPGDFRLSENVRDYCTSTLDLDRIDLNGCSDFIEYDGSCLHIGLNPARYPWSLKTGGKTLLTLVLVYRSSLERARNLVLPFFGWNTTCHGDSGSDCTVKDEQHLGLQTLERNSPFVPYQLATNQMLLADINEEHHISAEGIKSTLYPTSFVGFPLDVRNEFGDVCRQLEGEFDQPCRVVYLGLRSLTRVVKTTREEDQLSIAIRSIVTTSSQLSLVMVIMAFLFGYVVTRLTLSNPSGYLDHDLREAVLFLIKENKVQI